MAVHAGLDVTIFEPDVSPLQLQGPRSLQIMTALFGEEIESLKYYWLRQYTLDGIPWWSPEQDGQVSLAMNFIFRMAAGAQNYGKKLWPLVSRSACSRPYVFNPSH